MGAQTAMRCVAYMALLIVVAVGADRLFAERLYEDRNRLVPTYRSFNEPSVGVKLRDLDKTSTYLNTLVIGNSRTLAAVRPESFDHELDHLGARSETFNVAMPTVDVRFWPPFFEHFYDRAPPREVLLGVIPRDLDERNVVAQQQARLFEASPGFENHDRTELWKDAEEALARMFTLRGRGNEIRGAGVKGLLRGDKLDRPGFKPAGDRGGAVFEPGLVLSRAELAAKARRLGKRSGSIRLRVGKAQLAALARLDRLTRARGGCLTLFTTPLLYDREPLGTVEVAREFRRVLRTFAREHPLVTLLDIGPDLQMDYDLSDFSDGDHLSPNGARRFSKELATAAAPYLLDPGCGSLDR